MTLEGVEPTQRQQPVIKPADPLGHCYIYSDIGVQFIHLLTFILLRC